MKRTYLFLIPLVLFIIGCHNENTFKIGISQCSDDDWRQKMNGEIMREIMFHPGVEVEILSADDNSQRQIEQIEYFVNNNFDILVVAPNEADALTPVIEEVYDAGIPVVIFDRSIHSDSFTAFQGADNFDIGRTAARFGFQERPNASNILEIHGLAGSTPAIERHNGFTEVVEDLLTDSALETVYGEWTYESTFPIVDSIFSARKDIDIVYAHNDRMALAASDAAKKAGIAPLIIGIDAAPDIGMKAVADGTIDATFLYPTEGDQLLQTAIAILEGKPFERVKKFPSLPAVTGTNVGVLLEQQRELAKETGHLEDLKQQLDEYWEKHTAQNTFLIAAIIIIILSFVVIFMVMKAYWTHKRNREALASQNIQLAQQKDELAQQKDELAQQKDELARQKDGLIELNYQLNEATQSKLMFFTNVSHDLRTPLTLIAEPVSQLTKATNLTSQQMGLIKIADKNIRILNRLISQILDFRKFENNKLQLNESEENLADLVSEWTHAFSTLAKKRHMKLQLAVGAEARNTTLAVDAEKIERVFFNIVSNAFKYTPDNGRISIRADVTDNKFLITVEDTGKGISADDLKNIFDTFYQVDRTNTTGSGIGLALAKAFVEMHGGTIRVSSRPGEGTTFTVEIPVKHTTNTVKVETSSDTAADIEAELMTVDRTEPEIDPAKPVLLVIDDNEDICNLITRLLGDEYNVITASNGKTGLKMASKYVPDAIVCDVMMPVMDGLECCRLLKEEVSTSHIPVLMLTACSMDEQRVQGFESGADGYLAKPFNLDVLKSHIRNLIRNRRLIKNLWHADAAEISRLNEPVPEQEAKERLKKATSPVDNEFYQRFVALVTTNMSDPSLNVDKLAGELGLARSQFYRKIKALTNFSPVELLRQMRLKHARELLMTTEKTISEIGYEAGFSSAAYFTKCYRDEYGETPSQLRERLGHTE